MIKCLFSGHKWKHDTTYTGKRTSFNWLGKNIIDHDLTVEYYQCEKCGLWKQKIFVDHQLEERNYFKEKPIENERK